MMNEVIYNLIPKEEEKPPKPPRHVSQFRAKAKQETNENKVGGHKTFGHQTVPLESTENFTRKNHMETTWKTTNAKKARIVREDKHCEGSPAEEESVHKCSRRDPVPSKDDKPLMGIRTTKNYVHTNAVENILSVPRKPEKAYVDTRTGQRNLLEPSGLEPVHLKRKDYGKIPDYLLRREDEMKRAQEEYDAYVREHMRRGQLDQLPESDRQAIISGLKSNWERLHRVYQSLSVIIDTIPKKIRKERLESEMQQLEKDIQLLERHTVIYVA